jgi:hypothetical protein
MTGDRTHSRFTNCAIHYDFFKTHLGELASEKISPGRRAAMSLTKQHALKNALKKTLNVLEIW